MRVLLTTIGSQGDVRPLVALASRLRESGHGAHLCVSPDLRDWVEGLGFPFTPIGPQMRGMVGAPAPKPAGSAPPPSPEQMRGQVEATLARESATITEAARGCEVIVAAVESAGIHIEGTGAGAEIAPGHEQLKSTNPRLGHRWLDALGGRESHPGWIWSW